MNAWLLFQKKNNDNQITFYRKNTLTNPTFLQPFCGKNAIGNESENVKLFDDSMLCMDFKHKSYRKALKKFSALMDKKESTPLKTSETIYVKPDKPCSDPLPPFWK